MNNILEKINSATSSEINEMIGALLHRYSSLFPDGKLLSLVSRRVIHLIIGTN